jgi:hypothetical protein
MVTFTKEGKEIKNQTIVKSNTTAAYSVPIIIPMAWPGLVHHNGTHCHLNIYFFFTEVRGAASNSAYYGYPELWILRYPAHRYHAVRWPGFEPTTLWLRVRRPNHSAMCSEP